MTKSLKYGEECYDFGRNPVWHDHKFGRTVVTHSPVVERKRGRRENGLTRAAPCANARIPESAIVNDMSTDSGNGNQCIRLWKKYSVRIMEGCY